MLMPLPTALHRLVEEYETLLAEETLAGVTAPGPRLRDLAYTLCVSTGTREIADALTRAHAYLATAAAPPVHVRRTVTAGPAARATAALPREAERTPL
ncbi:DUF5133 domain-containing protein [Streptomyces sp. NBC_01428]|uniref:DUF5133 domain-containing protein n=1 Tax=Streptomyces sp. NBC_01428 TaxID=2903861 RepID=UPI002E3413B7|nr:DUF5133 domain-containing protein [Streptomyces sp. NBC_01428]